MKSFREQAEAIVLNALSFCDEEKNTFNKLYPNGTRSLSYSQLDHVYGRIMRVLEDSSDVEVAESISIIYDDELDIMCVVKGDAHQAVQEIQDTVDIDEVETALHDKGFEILNRNDIIFGEKEDEDEEDVWEQRRRLDRG